MRKTIVIGLSALLLSSVAAFAAETQAGETRASLVNDPVERATDSPLVRAAKRALAARTGAAAGAVVINDQYLRANGGGHYAQNLGTLPPVTYGAYAGADIVAARSPAPKNTRAVIEKKVQELGQQQRILNDEADQGPYGEVGEDVVTGRMTQNQTEQQQLQQQLNMPRPSRPPQ